MLPAGIDPLPARKGFNHPALPVQPLAVAWARGGSDRSSLTNDASLFLMPDQSDAGRVMFTPGIIGLWDEPDFRIVMVF
jgi:hypothetical protein